MNWTYLSLGLQAATLVVGAFVTIYPPSKRLTKGVALAAIVLLGGGGLYTARQATAEADAKATAAQAEIVRLTREGDQRVERVQERLENVSERLAAKGIAVEANDAGRTSTALAPTPQR